VCLLRVDEGLFYSLFQLPHGIAADGQSHCQEGGSAMEAYCVKCRKKVEIKGPKAITMKNGRPATQGQCPGCGTKVFRIGKA